jgi:hypothetical protein
MYSFSVMADASFASILASMSFANVVGISGFATELWSGGDVLAFGNETTVADPAAGTSFTTSTINYTSLHPGSTYEIHASGMVIGSSGSYGGNLVLNTITPVPEPEIYAMLVAGLGVLGFVSRRKRQLGRMA